MPVVRLGCQGEEQALFRERQATTVCQQDADGVIMQLIGGRLDDLRYIFNRVFHYLIPFVCTIAFSFAMSKNGNFWLIRSIFNKV